jgi:serine/threonine protein kinase
MANNTTGEDDHRSYAGTVLYMAPEQEKKNYCFPVDLWALGVICLEMIRVPGIIHFNELHDDRNICLPDEYGSEFNSLQRRLLDSNPSNRPTADDTREILLRLSNTIKGSWNPALQPCILTKAIEPPHLCVFFLNSEHNGHPFHN